MFKPSMPFQNFNDFVKFVDDNETLTTGSRTIQFNYYFLKKKGVNK